MAVSIITPQERESGFDKFLRRLGGIANVANSGINAYASIKDIQAKNQAMDAAKLKNENDAQGIYGVKEIDPKDWVDAQNGESGAQSFKVRGPDGSVQEVFKRRYQEQKKAMSPLEEALMQSTIDKNKADAFATRNKPRVDALEKVAEAEKANRKIVGESGYRTDQLKMELGELKELVENNGTIEVSGPAGAEMDKKLYNIAIDYAKLVDPESIAREGEVAAAQKYMLPIRDKIIDLPKWMGGGVIPKGSGISNSTALSLIDKLSEDVDTRAKNFASNKASNKGLPELVSQKKKTEAPPLSPEALAKLPDDELTKLYNQKMQSKNQMRAR